MYRSGAGRCWGAGCISAIFKPSGCHSSVYIIAFSLINRSAVIFCSLYNYTGIRQSVSFTLKHLCYRQKVFYFQNPKENFVDKQVVYLPIKKQKNHSSKMLLIVHRCDENYLIILFLLSAWGWKWELIRRWLIKPIPSLQPLVLNSVTCDLVGETKLLCYWIEGIPNSLIELPLKRNPIWSGRFKQFVTCPDAFQVTPAKCN